MSRPPLKGTIVSFDENLAMGLIATARSQQAIPFLVGDIRTDAAESTEHLIGRNVRYSAIDTPRGPIAVNIQLSKSSLKPRPISFSKTLKILPFAVVATLLLVTTFGLSHYLKLSHLASYLISVNSLAFMLAASLGSATLDARRNEARISMWGLSMLGGACAALLASLFVRGSRVRDATRFALFVVIVVQGFSLYLIAPGLFSKENIESVLHSAAPYLTTR